MTLTHGHIRSPARIQQGSGLSFKDFIAFLFVGAGVIGTYAAVADWGWPMLGSIRGAAAAVGIAGALACSVAAQLTPETFKTMYGKITSALGGLAVALVLAALVTGIAALLVALASVTTLLWVIATTRHAAGH